MRSVHDLSERSWTLAGSQPHMWELTRGMEVDAMPDLEIRPIPARVPGSVQQALRDAGLLADWNLGLNHRACEWVENRHWLFSTTLPSAWFANGARVRLLADGLDGNGRVFFGGRFVGGFANSFVPHAFDLPAPADGDEDATLVLAFENPPRWLGQIGRTSTMREWKPRFNYTWDWQTRLVQLGVCDRLRVEIVDAEQAPRLEGFRCYSQYDPASGEGAVRAFGRAPGARAVRLTLRSPNGEAASREFTPAELAAGAAWPTGRVQAWWPLGMGAQTLYDLTAEALDVDGRVHDARTRRLGFRRVEWRPCEGAPPEADPWICVVNDTPLFLQGVNWTPLETLFADVADDDYRRRVGQYRELGMNVFRVWGGAVLERAAFYDACDEAGILVWQELPLSSSAIDNRPPDDPDFVEDLGRIARSYAQRRQHHASLILWCGGNELQTAAGGGPGAGRPLDARHPALARAGEVFASMDPERRYVPTSASGPRFTACETEYGRGLHWDVHGPWKVEKGRDPWARYWADDDALLRSEAGAPAACDPEAIRRRAGGGGVFPPTRDNPLWRQWPWWVEDGEFGDEHGRQPVDLEEYCAWSRERQAWALVTAFRSAKERFPRCGGMLFWMGHDTSPCFTGPALMEYGGAWKPAAEALRPWLRRPPGAANHPDAGAYLESVTRDPSNGTGTHNA